MENDGRGSSNYGKGRKLHVSTQKNYLKIVIEHFVVMDELYLNSIINHCIRTTIRSGDVVSYLYKIIKFNT